MPRKNVGLHTARDQGHCRFDQVEEDGTTTISWIANPPSDDLPDQGDTIVVRLTYPTGGPAAPLFRGEVVDREFQQDDHTLKITCQGLLGAP